jgi:peptidyl-tRNA hydrolase
MKAEDIINWPLDIKFMPIYQLGANKVRRLHELAIKDQLDFSPEFLRIREFQLRRSKSSKHEFPKINNNNEEPSVPRITEGIQHHNRTKEGSNRHKDDKSIYVRNELRADVTKYLADKLAKKLNVSNTLLPWSQMKAEDVINWPSDLKFMPVNKMTLHELKMLHKLVKEDLLDFTPQFLRNFKIISLYGHELRHYVTKYLVDKLAKKFNMSLIRIPWTKMTAEDIINWPSEVQFKPIYQMNTNDTKMLHALAREDLLDFSPTFLRRLRKRPWVRVNQ